MWDVCQSAVLEDWWGELSEWRVPGTARCESCAFSPTVTRYV
jgi:hypothetical protein